MVSPAYPGELRSKKRVVSEPKETYGVVYE
jgi:hypothetical protein